MVSFFSIVLITTLLTTYLANSQTASCHQFTTAPTCNNAGYCTWLATPQISSTVQCVCSSTAELDILIGIDASGSIGDEHFEIQKQFISDLVTQEISDTARIGFTVFATGITVLSPIIQWTDTQTIYNFVNDTVTYVKGWTNTRQLLNSTLTQFQDVFIPNREKILLMITDGNPCLQGDCPHSVCQYKNDSDAADIKVVIVGIGDGLNREYVDCLVQNQTTDFIPLIQFDASEFDLAKNALCEITCPGYPTSNPTQSPTAFPTDFPSTNTPSYNPSKYPSTITPTDNPSKIPSRAPIESPTFDPSSSPVTKGPTSNPLTNDPSSAPTKDPVTFAPTRSPIDYKFCNNNGDRGNDNVAGKFIMDYSGTSQDGLSYEEVCEWCFCNDDDELSTCVGFAAIVTSINDEIKDQFMEACGFKDECQFEEIDLRPQSKRINRCGCEMFECVPLGGAVNEASNMLNRYTFILTLSVVFMVNWI